MKTASWNSRHAFEHHVLGHEIWPGRSVGQSPCIRATGLDSVFGCLCPPVGISASRSRQRESQEVFNLPEGEDYRIGVPLIEVLVEESVLSRRDHVSPQFV